MCCLIFLWELVFFWPMQNDLEQVLRQIGDKDQKIQNLEALLQKSKDSVSQLEAERDDLCAKIQAGEGEAAVLNQLKEKNYSLQEQVLDSALVWLHSPTLWTGQMLIPVFHPCVNSDYTAYRQAQEPVWKPQTGSGQHSWAGAGAEDPTALSSRPLPEPRDHHLWAYHTAHREQREDCPARHTGTCAGIVHYYFK